MQRGKYLSSGDEYEAELIRFSNVHYAGGEWPVNPGESFNINISDDGGTSVANMRVDKDTEIDGMDQPIEPFYVSGISEEYNGVLQIRPQVYHDFSTTTDPGFENNFKLEDHWQNRPAFWEFYPLVETPSFTVAQNGPNVYNSDVQLLIVVLLFHLFPNKNHSNPLYLRFQDRN